MSTRDTLNYLKNTPSNLKDVTINGAYTLPLTIGNPFDLMAVPASGTILTWDNGGGGGGGVNSVSNVDPLNTILVPTEQGNVTVAVNPNLSLSSLTITDQYILPSTIGTAGQVLAVPNSGNTLVWSSDAGGTVDSVIAGSPNMIISPTTGNVVVNLSQSVDIETLTINNSYVLPSTIGNVGDTLVVQSGTNVLEFAPNEGSGVTGLLNTDNQITLSGSTGNVTVGLANNIQVQSLYINNGSANYFLPNVQGNVGDTIVIQSGTNQLGWSPNEGSGVTSLTAGADGNINLDANTGDIIINLSNTISVDGLTLNSYPIQDPATASANQVLAINPTNNGIIWIDDVSGGVNSISNTDSNITFSAPTGAVTCALSSTVNIQNLELGGSSFQNPNSGGSPYEALTLDSSNNMVWTGVVNSISNTDTNISVSNPNGTIVLDLAPSISVTGITINGSTFESPQNGNVADILALDANKNMVWVPDTAGTGVTDINNSDGNISVSNPTGTVTLDLASSIAVENITIGLAPNSYAMPSAIGTDGQILGITGSTISWVNDTAGNFTVEGTTNQITANTVNDVCTISLPDPLTFPGTVNVVSGILNSAIINNSNSITTGSITIGQPTTDYTMPSSIGTDGQILGITGTTISWVNDTAGNFTVEGTENQIIANTANDVCTISLPNSLQLPQSLLIPENGQLVVIGETLLEGDTTISNTLNSGNINNILGITTGSLICSGALSMYNSPFQAPGYGAEGSVLTIDTSTDPYSLNWVPPIVVTGTANEIDATYGTTDVVLSFPNNTMFPTNISTCTIGGGAIAIGNNALGTDPQDVDGTNIGIGANCGSSITNGQRNICIGDSSATIISGSNDNISIGWNANNGGSGSGNVCIGSQTGYNMNNTNNNVIIGFTADVPAIGGNNSQVNINNMIKMNSNGTIAIGTNNNTSLSATGNGSLIVSVGDNCLTNLVQSNGNNMVAIGSNTANNITTGNYNTLLGNQNLAFGNNVTPNNNVVIGNFVGQTLSSGSQNIVIGNLSCNGDDTEETSCNNNIVIGNNSCNTLFTVSSENNVIIGNNTDVQTTGLSNYLCISTNVPVLYGNASQLQTPNFKNIWNTNPTVSGQVLTSDTSGNLSWYTPPSTTFDFSFNGGPTNPSSLIDFGSVTLINQNRLVSMRIPFSFAFGGSGYFTVGPWGVDQWVSLNNLPANFCPLYVYQFYVPVCEVSPPAPPPVPQIPIAIGWFNLQITIYPYGTIIMRLYDLTNQLTTFVSGSSYMFNTYDGYQNSTLSFGGCDYGITYYDQNGPS